MDELRVLDQDIVTYTAYNDGGTFIHIAKATKGEPGDVIGKLPAFSTFREMMKDSLVTPPVQTELNLVDSSKTA